jgi:hypothetical protein
MAGGQSVSSAQRPQRAPLAPRSRKSREASRAAPSASAIRQARRTHAGADGIAGRWHQLLGAATAGELRVGARLPGARCGSGRPTPTGPRPRQRRGVRPFRSALPFAAWQNPPSSAGLTLRRRSWHSLTCRAPQSYRPASAGSRAGKSRLRSDPAAPTSTSGWCGCQPLTSAPLMLVRPPRIAQAEVDVRNRCARLPVTARVGPLARPRPPGTTAALTSDGTASDAATRARAAGRNAPTVRAGSHRGDPATRDP